MAEAQIQQRRTARRILWDWKGAELLPMPLLDELVDRIGAALPRVSASVAPAVDAQCLICDSSQRHLHAYADHAFISTLDLEVAKREFLNASIAVWREIDRLSALPDGYHGLPQGADPRKRELAAWEAYRALLDALAKHKPKAAPASAVVQEQGNDTARTFRAVENAYEEAAMIAENCTQDEAARDEPFRIAQTIREHAKARLLTMSTASPAAPSRHYFCSCGATCTAEEYIEHYFEKGHDRGDLKWTVPDGPVSTVAPVEQSNWLLDCPMCSAPKSFAIDSSDDAVGFCLAERRNWRIIDTTCVTDGCFQPKATFGDLCMDCLAKAVDA